MTAEERLANDPTSELWGEHRSRYRFALQYAAGARVLDVATGAGFGLQMLRSSGADAVGVDYDARALGALGCADPGLRLACGDAMRLPVADNAFDVVVSFETIEHVPDARALVCEIRRVLKPGGRLVLSTPNRDFGPAERHTANPFHIREFTAEELRDLLCEAFAEVRLYGQRPSTAYRYVPFLMFDRDLSPRALAWKLLLRLPFRLRDAVARAVSGRPFYPGETDYCFVADKCDGAHCLVAVAQ